MKEIKDKSTNAVTQPLTTNSLPLALLRARERIMQPLRPLLLDSELTEQQWRVLRVLYENGVIEPTEIAEKTCLLLPSLTRILKFLEDRDYVVRERHESDGRRFLFTITDQGRNLLLDKLPIINAVLTLISEKYTPEKTNQLIDLLNELIELELNWKDLRFLTPSPKKHR
ncbi:homoprotocatechuate degradation operon regulator HpaR [Polycladidibacter stylochi]|uniref:homoprotocatechuate degradation operon regulator HpaR n=1 Tax=Polycladidibacter stylochi TaxID=1807766 RepID=UPI00082CFE27|nr:homoprotocatechuate degradation operon regulator HpaR [Pseudovibrio stylochi]